jgi:hypothetical protein
MRSLILSAIPVVTGSAISIVGPTANLGNWNQITGPALCDAPSAISLSPESIHVFGIAEGSHSCQHAVYENGKWGAMQDLGGILTGTPSVTAFDQNRLDLFSRGADNALYQQTYQPQQGWSGFTSLGGVLASQPISIARAQGKLEVLAKGQDEALMYRSYQNPDWSDWLTLGTQKVKMEPAVSYVDADHLDIFVVGTDNACYHNAYISGELKQPDWENLGGSLSSRLSAVTLGSNRIMVFGRATDGTLQQISYDGSRFGDWENLGGFIQEGTHPVAAVPMPNRVEVYVTGTDNAVFRRVMEGTQWADWENMGGHLNYYPAVVSPAGAEKVDIFTTGDKGALYCNAGSAY